MNKDQKQEKIVSMFDEIASTYDMTNRVLSMGIDKSWRKKGCDKTLELLDRNKDLTVLDVACGTGDMLQWWKDRGEAAGVTFKRFIGVDPSEGMLEVAKEKVDYAEFIVAKAQDMPVEENTADILSISYGIRNVVDRQEAINEFYRVLKPGGMVVILEFTKRDKSGLKGKIVDFYMHKILPTIGGLVSRNYEAYRYLPDSIEGFLTTEMLQQELESAGFTMQYTQAFSMGISTLLIAKK
ncbi:bifunctional demethylmenaquinone methyltransferase/2-methoxy-6-polyprenyl-1,4-benzoquinol methylase UbiE [Hydrogenimonas thermophila]|uniref:bifunctional demethylmenaquinone methyltransferase/2-methoxy-6-polyprenyl-1,4-benzoquinol methylase UbiE n=1 Tax=Hydrogenimonas thermophila TaxID=223786 RepID=UPI002936E9BF|nr:bifunctional demethylmenaquinone methyltransferase/2-methoxy-6-polyprenyl-1,4-benzoquinol methylase UbiE [Hydrogenimonas thermophila]WOE70426.1 bifunctional demethylmenaquinone methyltransferase/2-methoxy-6-polyprenyl-1,4-benzoquinol methylase UbiE [Hydrogenimonas thermophila]WOE72941.1 bifunctional demethylmenaquinone methyltransferase/2-methoxy-6-polyprenyl-1,4-benzoquinol methylase UbiE [Hydrogenimonas thermophila]